MKWMKSIFLDAKTNKYALMWCFKESNWFQIVDVTRKFNWFNQMCIFFVDDIFPHFSCDFFNIFLTFSLTYSIEERNNWIKIFIQYSRFSEWFQSNFLFYLSPILTISCFDNERERTVIWIMLSNKFQIFIRMPSEVCVIMMFSMYLSIIWNSIIEWRWYFHDYRFYQDQMSFYWQKKISSFVDWIM